MADKKLTIAVDAKVSPQVQQMTRLLDDLAARGNKFARAIQGVSGGGEHGAMKAGGLAKALLSEKKLFEDLGKSGEKLAKILSEQVTKSQAALQKQLEESTRRIDPLMKKYEAAIARVDRLKRQGADPKLVGMFETSANELGGQVTAAAAEQRQAQSAVNALKGPQAQAGMMSIAQGIASKVMAGVGAGLLIGSTINAGVQTVRSYYNAPYAGRAAMGAAAAGGMGAFQGDIWEMMSMRQAIGDPDRASRMWWAAQSGGVNNVMTMLKAVTPFSGTPLSELMGTARSWQERISTGLVTEDIDRMNQLAQADPVMAAKVRMLAQRAPGNVSMMREMGVDPWSLQESREIAARFGQMGIDEHDALFRRHASGAGARGAAGLMRSADMYSAIRGGLTSEVASSLNLAGALAGTNLLNRGYDYDLEMQRLVGGQVSGAILNPNSLYSRGGGAGYMAQMYAGIEPNMSGPAAMRLLQQNMAGDAAFSGLSQGDAFQQSLNLANSIGVLGRRGVTNVLAQQKLAGVFRDPAALSNVLAGGDLPGQWKGVGLQRGDVKEFASDTLRQAAAHSRRFGGATPGSKLIERWLGGERNFSAEQFEMMGGVLAEARPGMFDDVSGATFFRRASALGSGTPMEEAWRGRTDTAKGTPELTALSETTRHLVTNLARVGTTALDVAGKLSELRQAVDATARWMTSAIPVAQSYAQPFLFRAGENPDAYKNQSRE